MRQVNDLQSVGQDTSSIDYLCVSGTDTDTQLKNPVYWDEGNSTLVWVALLRDNQGVYDTKGNLVTPHLLSPAFDNTYINCHALPLVPRDTEAAYRANGAFMEGDEVEVVLSPPQQQLESPDSEGNYSTVHVDGFVRKFNFMFSSSRVPLDRDLCVPGT